MLRFRLIAFAAVAAVAVLSVAALGHPGPRIWVNVDDGKVDTYAGAYPPGNPADYHLSRVFTQALLDDDGTWDSDFPGYQMVPGGKIPPGTQFSYNITGPLLYYSQGVPRQLAGFLPVTTAFGPSSSVPQMAVTNELFQTKVTGGGFVGGDLAYAFNGGAGDHNHLTYTLLGDGTTAEGGPDGVYALPLQLTSVGLADSDTFYLLLSKNASSGLLADAAAFAEDVIVGSGLPRQRWDRASGLCCDVPVQVPEPGALAWLAMAPGLMRRRRR